MKDFWNTRYAEEGFVYGDLPNAYLTSVISQLPATGKVLVVGDGEGRNGVWLAEQGYDVTSVDYSSIGVDKAKVLARQRNVLISAECQDLTRFEWPQGVFDAVVTIYLHFDPEVRALMHKSMMLALKSGGILIMEAFNKAQLQFKSGGPPVESMLFSEQMLKEDFQDASIIELYETVTRLNEGKYHVGDGAVVRLIAKKG